MTLVTQTSNASDKVAVPLEVLDAFRVSAAQPIASGLINQTYRVTQADGEKKAILQRLHPIFPAKVNNDIDQVTGFLRDNGFDCPKLIRSAAGGLYYKHAQQVWRVWTYVEGSTHHVLTSTQQATQAGLIVGDFHRSIATLEYRYEFSRIGHDLLLRKNSLQQCMDNQTLLSKLPTALANGTLSLAKQILAIFANIQFDFAVLPKRHCHGDLKVSNIRFSEDGSIAKTLVDWDTIGFMPIAFELGDALRSWANPKGEDTSKPVIDLSIIEAAMTGFAKAAPSLLSDQEVASIAPGLLAITTELAARFCIDVFENSYFGWDAETYPSRQHHNLVRAQGQCHLATNIHNTLPKIKKLILDTIPT